jgi:two-component system, LytTR family, sensor kinase
MKKTIIAFLGLIFCIYGIPSVLYAQHQGYVFGHHILFESISTDTRFMVRQPGLFAANDDNVSQVFEYFDPQSSLSKYGISKDVIPKSPMLLGVRLNPDLEDYLASGVMSISKSYSAYFISDSSEAELIALGITPDNAKDYKYHVVENDSVERVPWSPVLRMTQEHGAKKPYALLGRYRAPGKRIMIEVINTKNYSIRDGVIFDWRIDYKPRISQMIVAKANNVYFNINYAKLNCKYATRFDSLSGLPLDLKFPVDSVEELSLGFKQHETVPYSLYLVKNIGAKVDTVLVEYIFTGDTYLFGNKWFDKPGKYQLLIHRAKDLGSWEDQQMLRLPFEVLPPPLIEKKVSIKQLLPYILGAIALMGLAFAGYYRYNKSKLKRATEKNEAVSLQLKSIRSQLNPHFMFNALAAIQGLMNKNDVAGARHYLAKFANLTRMVLQSGEVEMISLEDELRMLDDYLQMEQLRFGFAYGIRVDEAINQANTEIPLMLLQPFVENAVKHGVASLLQQGKIEVSVEQNDHRLILTVKDNGSGFAGNLATNMTDHQATTITASQTATSGAGQTTVPGTGLGLKLSRQRIALLNQKYKSPRVSLVVNSGTAGTTVTIQLDQWI